MSPRGSGLLAKFCPASVTGRSCMAFLLLHTSFSQHSVLLSSLCPAIGSSQLSLLSNCIHSIQREIQHHFFFPPQVLPFSVADVRNSGSEFRERKEKGSRWVLWNIALTRQRRVTFVYALEYYFNCVKMCYFCLCCLCLICKDVC